MQEAYRFLGESIGTWLQTGAFIFSAIYAGRQVRLLRKQTDKNETQHRLRATVDVALHEKQDRTLRHARVLFAKLRDQQNNFTQFACKPSSEHPAENAAIMAILNSYEFIAVGIREGAFDEAIYKRMKKSLVLRDWETLSGYATEMRTQHKRPKLFAEFQWLAEKWGKEDEPITLSLRRED